MNAEKITVIIPAYKPDEKLLDLLNELVENGAEDILVVNDGSGDEFEPVFERVREVTNCTLLVHEQNKGKGAAMKTAFAFFMENRPDRTCVVTADADGQHLTKDILAVANSCAETGKVVFGIRDFTSHGVVARSRFGNWATSLVFLLFFGMKLKDTQTGLRAFPRKYLQTLAMAKGDRYEYEMNVLFMMNKKQIPYEQIEIETIYLDGNKTSHFRIIRDSIRIYSLIIKYLLSSVASAVIDEGAFCLFKYLTFLTVIPIPLTVTAAILARIVSSLTNFAINAKVVFGEKPSISSLVKYYILAVIQLSVSTLLVFGVENLLHIESPILVTLAKTIIDIILFFFSFRIQHRWVYNKTEDINEEEQESDK